MFAYPSVPRLSGTPQLQHRRRHGGSEAASGYNVLHPFGWDAFAARGERRIKVAFTPNVDCWPHRHIKVPSSVWASAMPGSASSPPVSPPTQEQWRHQMFERGWLIAAPRRSLVREDHTVLANEQVVVVAGVAARPSPRGESGACFFQLPYRRPLKSIGTWATVRQVLRCSGTGSAVRMDGVVSPCWLAMSLLPLDTI